jgi:ribosomal protein L30E
MTAAATALRRLVGLAVRSRTVTVGREACKRAARRGELYVLLVAEDAGRSAARDCGATAATRVLHSRMDKRELGALVGRDAVAALGITDPHLADGLMRHAAPVAPDTAEEPPRG